MLAAGHYYLKQFFHLSLLYHIALFRLCVHYSAVFRQAADLTTKSSFVETAEHCGSAKKTQPKSGATEFKRSLQY